MLVSRNQFTSAHLDHKTPQKQNPRNPFLKQTIESQLEDTPTDSICVDCGLCCSGAIFEDVELNDEDEANSMEAMGLEIEEEDGSFLLIQPCKALSGFSCRVYHHRPQCCRTFECHLLKNVQSGQTSKEQAFNVIQEIRTQLAHQNRRQARELIHQHLLKW